MSGAESFLTLYLFQSVSFTTFSTTSLPSSYNSGILFANLYTVVPRVSIFPPYAIPISITNGKPEYADAVL